MKPARGILVPVVASLVLGCALATFAATEPKSEPAAPNPQPAAVVPAVVAPTPAAVLPAPLAAIPASVPTCGQGALADPGFTSETGAVPVAGDNCPCYSYGDCELCCQEEYSNFMCHTQQDKHHHPIYPGVCFCWN